MLQTARIVPLLLLVSSLAVACNQGDLGRYCFVGADDSSNTNTDALTILNVEAPECVERLCLKQGGYQCEDGEDNCSTTPDKQMKIQPMCTQECSENKDCEKSEENVNHCGKFVCQAQGDETGFGGHCICVCLDFIRSEGSAISEEDFNTDPDYNSCK